MTPAVALVMGFTFSFAWTPCVGPTLSSVLLMASSAESSAAGFLLIGVYTLGFVLPFLAVGLFTGTVLDFFKSHQNVVRYTVKIGAVLLIVMAVSRRIKDIMVILILGMMFGSGVSSMVEILQYLSSEAALKSFVIWTMGSLGDVTGGNLALVLCNRLKTAGRKLPGTLILMSPWTDMTMSGQSYTERAEIDPMLTPEYIEAVRLAYAAGRDYRSSDLSPLFADFTGFPPTLIQVGDHEILYSDSEQLYQAMKRANVPCRLQVSEGMWHVFQMFPIRKASVAIENIARFLLEQ